MLSFTFFKKIRHILNVTQCFLYFYISFWWCGRSFNTYSPTFPDPVILKIFYLLPLWQVICFINRESSVPDSNRTCLRWDSTNIICILPCPEQGYHLVLPSPFSSHLHEYECILGLLSRFRYFGMKFILINFQEDQWLYSRTRCYMTSTTADGSHELYFHFC